MNANRRNSAPAILKTPHGDDAFGDAPLYDYTTSSDTSETGSSSGENTDGENEYEDWPDIMCEDTQHCYPTCLNGKCKGHLQNDSIEKHQCSQCIESVRNTSSFCSSTIRATTKHARTVQCVETLGVIEQILKVDGGNDNERFPAFTEDSHFEDALSPAADTNSESTGNSRNVSGKDGDENLPTRDLSSVKQHRYSDPSQAEVATSAVDRNQDYFTPLPSFDRQGPEGPNRTLHGKKRLHRQESYYFSLSQDLRHANGDALIIAKVRVSRDI